MRAPPAAPGDRRARAQYADLWAYGTSVFRGRAAWVAREGQQRWIARVQRQRAFVEAACVVQVARAHREIPQQRPGHVVAGFAPCCLAQRRLCGARLVEAGERGRLGVVGADRLRIEPQRAVGLAEGRGWILCERGSRRAEEVPRECLPAQAHRYERDEDRDADRGGPPKPASPWFVACLLRPAHEADG